MEKNDSSEECSLNPFLPILNFPNNISQILWMLAFKKKNLAMHTQVFHTHDFSHLSYILQQKLACLINTHLNLYNVHFCSKQKNYCSLIFTEEFKSWWFCYKYNSLQLRRMKDISSETRSCTYVWYKHYLL